MIVLDTHTLVWWVAGDPLLSKAAKAAISRVAEPGGIIVSAISTWEIALLVARGKLVLSMDVDAWLETIKAIEQIRFMPIDNEIATKSVLLPGQLHNDPADRMIIATARKLAAPLVTRDEKIRAYPHVKTIW
jgi:PIN domain nuclease of toxin-antitoxin system